MSFWHNKTVLVAGGAGFIGQHLCRALAGQGAHIHIVDNFSTGHRQGLDQATIHEIDICEKTALPHADIIFNLASPASPLHYQRDPIQTWKTNVLGALHLMDHAQALGATLVQASTSEVYGDPLQHPQNETHWGNVNPIGPRACYDESKRAAEALLMDAVRTMDADVRIARIFNTYGPGMDVGDGRAVPNFIAQANAGDPITVFGDGTQTRSLCYVSDTVDALLRLAAVPQARGEVINIGNPNEISVLDIAKRVQGLLGSSAPITFHPAAIDDPVRRCPDIAKAMRILNWQPVVSLEQGLSLTVAAMTGKNLVPTP